MSTNGIEPPLYLAKSACSWLCYGLALTALTLAIAAASTLVPLLAVTGV